MESRTAICMTGRTSLRTHLVEEVTLAHEGEHGVLCGWIETFRDHGGLLFLHLRDASGRIQIVADPEPLSEDIWEVSQELRAEWCVRVEGVVVRRPEGKDRTALDKKDVELP